MKEPIITVIGSANYDIIMKQKRLAMKGETYTADSIAFSGGGKGANQAVQAAKLGAETHMIGQVGRDTFGDYLIGELEKYQVNLDHMERSDNTTGIGIVHALETGEVYATITTGANGDVSCEQIDRAEDLIARSKILIIQLEIPVECVEYAIEIGKKHGCLILLNAAPSVAISDHALSQVDCLIVNEPEASFYCGVKIDDYNSAQTNFHKLYTHFQGVLVITLGAQGSFLYDTKEVFHIPTNDVDVVETTGAGDSYIGAMAFSLLQGKSYYDACLFGNLAAEITVTRVGAQSSMPYKSELPE